MAELMRVTVREVLPLLVHILVTAKFTEQWAKDALFQTKESTLAYGGPLVIHSCDNTLHPGKAFVVNQHHMHYLYALHAKAVDETTVINIMLYRNQPMQQVLIDADVRACAKFYNIVMRVAHDPAFSFDAFTADVGDAWFPRNDGDKEQTRKLNSACAFVKAKWFKKRDEAAIAELKRRLALLDKAFSRIEDQHGPCAWLSFPVVGAIIGAKGNTFDSLLAEINMHSHNKQLLMKNFNFRCSKETGATRMRLDGKLQLLKDVAKAPKKAAGQLDRGHGLGDTAAVGGAKNVAAAGAGASSDSTNPLFLSVITIMELLTPGNDRVLLTSDSSGVPTKLFPLHCNEHLWLTATSATAAAVAPPPAPPPPPAAAPPALALLTASPLPPGTTTGGDAAPPGSGAGAGVLAVVPVTSAGAAAAPSRRGGGAAPSSSGAGGQEDPSAVTPLPPGGNAASEKAGGGGGKDDAGTPNVSTRRGRGGKCGSSRGRSSDGCRGRSGGRTKRLSSTICVQPGKKQRPTELKDMSRADLIAFGKAAPLSTVSLTTLVCVLTRMISDLNTYSTELVKHSGDAPIQTAHDRRMMIGCPRFQYLDFPYEWTCLSQLYCFVQAAIQHYEHLVAHPVAYDAMCPNDRYDITAKVGQLVLLSRSEDEDDFQHKFGNDAVLKELRIGYELCGYCHEKMTGATLHTTCNHEYHTNCATTYVLYELKQGRDGNTCPYCSYPSGLPELVQTAMRIEGREQRDDPEYAGDSEDAEDSSDSD